MGEVAQQLGRALRAGAAHGGAVLIPLHRRTAHRARLGQDVGYCALRTLLEVHFQNLWDDLPRLLDDNGISNPDILLGDIVLIVQRRVGDGGSRQAHRRQHCLGRQHTGPAHLDHNVQHLGRLLLRRVFEGYRPLREFRCTS